jgi:adenylate cyclase
LPFANLGADPEQQYFADGLTEDIITALSLSRSFPVIARNSTFTYRGKAVKVQDVAKELGARYILEGSIRAVRNRVRVTAQLIDAETGHHVWAERYDREAGEIFALQDELTESIASIVAPEIENIERKRLVATKPTSLDAWGFVQRGMARLSEFSNAATFEARVLFEQALQIDPTYSRAYSGIAFTYMRDFWLGASKDRVSSLQKLSEFSHRAVALDETDSLAHVTAAFSFIWGNDLSRAVTEAEIATRLNPTSAQALACLGHAQAMYGDVDAGIRNSEKSLKLNPRDPFNHQFMLHIALAYLISQRYEAALDWARKAIDRNPNMAEYHFVLASILGHMGAGTEGRRALEACQRIDPNFLQGWTAGRPYIRPGDVATIYDGLRKAGWKG